VPLSTSSLPAALGSNPDGDGLIAQLHRARRRNWTLADLPLQILAKGALASRADVPVTVDAITARSPGAGRERDGTRPGGTRPVTLVGDATVARGLCIAGAEAYGAGTRPIPRSVRLPR
jgi:hypothetical protein